MNEDKFLEPFSPAILERQVPQKFIDIVNRVGDEVLSDETKSREWDFSENCQFTKYSIPDDKKEEFENMTQSIDLVLKPSTTKETIVVDKLHGFF